MVTPCTPGCRPSAASTAWSKTSPAADPPRSRVPSMSHRIRRGGVVGMVGREPTVEPVLDRLPLAHLPTPLEPMHRLGAALDMEPGALWVKRDDCTGLAGGGNKARKLEYPCAEALGQGGDTPVTGGGRQSKHAPMTAAPAQPPGPRSTPRFPPRPPPPP